MIFDTRAFARAGLLGNPSDGYFGKTISICVRNFGAHVSLYHSPELRIEPQEVDRNVFKSIFDLAEKVDLHGYYGGDRLIKASIRKFLDHCEENGIRLENKNFSVRYHSSIPRQVGLAGSSAIITAMFRALMAFYDVEIPDEILPTVILNVEREELGINAGLQDRVIQVYEGCIYMDFDAGTVKAKNHGIYKRIDPKLLPNLFIAYKTDLGKVSGQVLNDIRIRFEKGEKLVIDTLDRIAALAEEGWEAIESGRPDKLPALMNENFDLRSRIMKISDSNKEMVRAARQCGASAKFAGSGGSIIGVYENNEILNRLVVELGKINARVIKPYII